MTQVVAIYAAIAALVPVYDSDVTPIKVWNGALTGVIKQALPSAALPIRILTTTGENEGRDFAFIALGKLSKVVWTIEDLLLIKPVAEGDSLKTMSPYLITYCDSYITVLRDLRGPTSNSHVVAADFKPGMFEWGDNRYFGVDVKIEVEEFQGAA